MLANIATSSASCNISQQSYWILVLNNQFPLTMAMTEKNILLELVGIHVGSNGRKCRKHKVCGKLLKAGLVVHFKIVRTKQEGKMEPAMAAALVVNGRDSCRVGFLCQCYMKYQDDFVGKLAQVVKILNSGSTKYSQARLERFLGSCHVSIIDTESTNDILNS